MQDAARTLRLKKINKKIGFYKAASRLKIRFSTPPTSQVSTDGVFKGLPPNAPGKKWVMHNNTKFHIDFANCMSLYTILQNHP